MRIGNYRQREIYFQYSLQYGRDLIHGSIHINMCCNSENGITEKGRYIFNIRYNVGET